MYILPDWYYNNNIYKTIDFKEINRCVNYPIVGKMILQKTIYYQLMFLLIWVNTKLCEDDVICYRMTFTTRWVFHINLKLIVSWNKQKMIFATPFWFRLVKQKACWKMLWIKFEILIRNEYEHQFDISKRLFVIPKLFRL